MSDLAEHHALARLHQAESTSRLGKAIFDLVGSRLPNEMLFLSFLPAKFELPSLSSVPEYQRWVDLYMRCLNKYDVWLRRSPVGPHVKAVRHSDHTPLTILKRTRFYRDVMRPIHSDYGASIVVWHGEQWLATLTVFRNPRQGRLDRRGDGAVAPLAGPLRDCGPARGRGAGGAARRRFARHVHLGPAPFGDHPRLGLGAAPFQRRRRRALPPLEQGHTGAGREKPQPAHRRAGANPGGDLASQAASRVGKARAAGPLRPVELESLQHPGIRGLSAKISFIPSKALTLSPGRFLVQLYHESGAGRIYRARRSSRASRPTSARWRWKRPGD